MGNIHAFQHRLPALGTALLATTALVLVTLAGTSCSFVDVTAKEGLSLVTVEETPTGVESTSIGIMCGNELYSRSGDRMWDISFIFLVIGLSLGSIASALAWAVSTFLPPTTTNWKLLSSVASLTAVLQVPSFLILESVPCSDFMSVQSCSLSSGSYFLMASTALWVSVTLCTQCMDPPLWAIELAAWRISKTAEETAARVGDDDPELLEDAPQPSFAAAKKSNKRNWKSWWPRKRNRNLNVTATEESEPDHANSEVNDVNQSLLEKSYDRSLDQRVLLRIPPGNGAPLHPGQDGYSANSFEDLDSLVDMIEEGRLQSAPVMTPSVPRTEKSQSEVATDSRDYIIRASLPSESVDTLQIVQTDSHETSQLADNAAGRPPSAAAILQDLEKNDQTKPTDGEIVPEKDGRQQDRFRKGLRALTKKMRSDTQRLNRRAGYSMLDDDLSTGKDSLSKSMPPIEVKISKADVDNSNKIAFNNEDEADLMFKWENLHKKSTGDEPEPVNETCDDEEKKDDNDGDHERDARSESDVSSYHDPEPAWYESDDTSQSELSLGTSTLATPHSMASDQAGSMASSSIASSNSRSSRSSRGRFRLRKRNVSPVPSIRSTTSLLDLSIVEETAQDLDAETDGEDSHHEAYALKRTVSAPEAGFSARGRDYRRRHSDEDSRQGRRNTRSCSPRSPRLRRRRRASTTPERHALSTTSNKRPSPLQTVPQDLLDEVPEDALTPSVESGDIEIKEHVSEGYTSNEGQSISSDSLTSVADENYDPQRGRSRKTGASFMRSMSLPQKNESVHVDHDVKDSPRKSKVRSRSVVSSRSWKSWREQRKYGGGIHARLLTTSDQNSDSTSESSENYSQRAREARLHRLLHGYDTRGKKGAKESVESAEAPEHTARMARVDRLRSRKLSLKPSSSSSGTGSKSERAARTAYKTGGVLYKRVRSDSPPYESALVDSLDLQLIEVRRPIGAEYGSDEASM